MACGHRSSEVRPWQDHVQTVYGDGYFDGGGTGYADYLSGSELLREHGRRYARLLSNYLEPGSVLDVGCAAGFILKGFEDGGWQCAGIEPNERMATYARETLRLRIEQTTLEAYDSSERFDLIMMIQVVPHFVDPQAAFKAAAQLTRRAGYWLIETWNRRSWMARLFGRSWHEYSPPSVLHWFTQADLALLARRYGLQEIATGRPTKRIQGKQIKSQLAAQFEGTPIASLSKRLFSIVPDTFAVPYPGDDIYWALYRMA